MIRLIRRARTVWSFADRSTIYENEIQVYNCTDNKPPAVPIIIPAGKWGNGKTLSRKTENREFRITIYWTVADRPEIRNARSHTAHAHGRTDDAPRAKQGSEQQPISALSARCGCWRDVVIVIISARPLSPTRHQRIPSSIFFFFLLPHHL